MSYHCDFCSDELSVGGAQPVYAFDVPDFDIPGMTSFASTGGWAACATCASLVESGDRAEVLNRALKASPVQANVPAGAGEWIRGLHGKFWAAMDGLPLSARRKRRIRIALPVGFERLSFLSFVAAFERTVPDLTAQLLSRAAPREDRDGGADALVLINRLESNGLVMFARHAESNEPAIFAAKREDFESDSDAEAADRLVSWFDRTGGFDTGSGRILAEVDDDLSVLQVIHQAKYGDLFSRLFQWLNHDAPSRRLLDARVEALAKASGHITEQIALLVEMATAYVEMVRRLEESKRETELIVARAEQLMKKSVAGSARIKNELEKRALVLREDFNYMLDDFKRRYVKDVELMPAVNTVRLEAALDDLGQTFTPPGFSGQTLWMRAIEAQFEALRLVTTTLKVVKSGKVPANKLFPDQHWDFEYTALRRGDCYAWGRDPITAVRMASASIPLESQLWLEHVPSLGYGWFWFDVPLQIQTRSAASRVEAILWGWSDESKHDSLVVTAFARDASQGLLSSTVFRWQIGESIEQVLARCRAEYEASYGPGGRWHGYAASIEDVDVSRQRTLAAIESLARFVLSAFTWVKQEIISFGSGHVERHRRKQLARENKLERPPSDVKIIALRRVNYQSSSGGSAVGGESGRAYNVRWVVRAHPRNQWYPSKGRHELIWIDPYVKGPDDKPLKETKATVFAVTR